MKNNTDSDQGLPVAIMHEVWLRARALASGPWRPWCYAASVPPTSVYALCVTYDRVGGVLSMKTCPLSQPAVPTPGLFSAAPRGEDRAHSLEFGGFVVVATHLTASDCVWAMSGLPVVAMAWSHHVPATRGEMQGNPPTRGHGCPAYSLSSTDPTDGRRPLPLWSSGERR